jgi:ketosteroid isomerase-like protein
MKRILSWSLFGLVFLGSAAWLQAQNNGGTEQAIAAFEEQWLKGQNTNNPDLVAPLLADNFVNTSNTGQVTGKAETLADIQSTKWASGSLNNMKVNVFGNTAVATGGFKGKETDASGKSLEINERWTDTWTKMASGKWQCVASHQSLITM